MGEDDFVTTFGVNNAAIYMSGGLLDTGSCPNAVDDLYWFTTFFSNFCVFMNPAVNALFFTRYVQALADPGRLSSNGVTPTPESEPVVSLRCWSMVTTIDTAFRHVRQHNWQTLSTTDHVLDKPAWNTLLVTQINLNLYLLSLYILTCLFTQVILWRRKRLICS